MNSNPKKTFNTIKKQRGIVMKVTDLIEKLKSFPETAEVTFEQEASRTGKKFMLPIVGVKTVEAVKDLHRYIKPKYDRHGDITYPKDGTPSQIQIIVVFSRD
jgi:hypothetical protein